MVIVYYDNPCQAISIRLKLLDLPAIKQETSSFLHFTVHKHNFAKATSVFKNFLCYISSYCDINSKKSLRPHFFEAHGLTNNQMFYRKQFFPLILLLFSILWLTSLFKSKEKVAICRTTAKRSSQPAFEVTKILLSG